MSESKTYIFLDANLALHFKRADEIDWCDLTESSEVVLVVAPVFIRELEDEKVYNHKQKLRDRASETIRWLGRQEDSKPIRPQVSLMFLVREPQIDFIAQGLSATIDDDHLIASVIEFTAGDLHRVIVATNDLGLRMKLKARGLASLTLPDEYALPSEPDPRDTELTDLRRTLAAIESRQPLLRLVFSNEAQHRTISRRAFQQETIDIKAALAKIKSEYPFMQRETDASKRSGAVTMVATFNAASFFVTDDQIERYNAALEEFYRRHKEYLEKLQSWNDWRAHSCKLNLILTNSGNALASDIDVGLTFPDDVLLFESDDYPECPDAPTAPQRPGRFNFNAIIPPRMLANLNLQPIAAIGLEGEPCVDTDGHAVTFHIDRLKHHCEYSLGALWLVFPRETGPRSLTIDARTTAVELLLPTCSKLHLIVSDKPKSGAAGA